MKLKEKEVVAGTKNIYSIVELGDILVDEKGNAVDDILLLNNGEASVTGNLVYITKYNKIRKEEKEIKISKEELKAIYNKFL